MSVCWLFYFSFHLFLPESFDNRFSTHSFSLLRSSSKMKMNCNLVLTSLQLNKTRRRRQIAIESSSSETNNDLRHALSSWSPVLVQSVRWKRDKCLWWTRTNSIPSAYEPIILIAATPLLDSAPGKAGNARFVFRVCAFYFGEAFEDWVTWRFNSTL